MQNRSNATLKKCAPFFKSDSQSQHGLVSHNSRQKSDQRQLLYVKMAGKSWGARSKTTVLSKLKFGAKLSFCLVDVGLA